jgi:hypothetical protein
MHEPLRRVPDIVTQEVRIRLPTTVNAAIGNQQTKSGLPRFHIVATYPPSVDASGTLSGTTS